MIKAPIIYLYTDCSKTKVSDKYTISKNGWVAIQTYNMFTNNSWIEIYCDQIWDGVKEKVLFGFFRKKVIEQKFIASFTKAVTHEVIHEIFDQEHDKFFLEDKRATANKEEWILTNMGLMGL